MGGGYPPYPPPPPVSAPEKFHFCRLPFAVNVMLNLSNLFNTRNGERGTGNGERRTGNGERGTGNGERGTGNGERRTGNRNGERESGNQCTAITRLTIQNGGRMKRKM